MITAVVAVLLNDAARTWFEWRSPSGSVDALPLLQKSSTTELTIPPGRPYFLPGG